MATAKRVAKPREQRMVLGEDLRIGRIGEAVAALGRAGAKATVVIDVSSVAKIDAAGLQALAAFAAQWRAAGTRWRWENPPEALRSAARTAGLQATLQLE